ncbi:hypothetical protein [Streptomyces sp. NBC_01314]|uniref:hypothetical protein n=1 Tax=Streptomyces sp. NBC_01314 TaxID=2903821 RepID=UPI0030906796|nr:hypothetical protein OG622_34000 [Streptomyces sp. NBC_01314]
MVLVDGAAHQLELIRAEAARRKVEIHIVLDIVHVLEKLWAAARCSTPPPIPQPKTGSGPRQPGSWPVTPPGPSATSTPKPTARACPQISGPRRTACRYLENNAAYLHYDKALEASWPIDSGTVEGAARHLIADRLDIAGSRWSVCGAEAVLTLRAVISNGDFPQYWTFHTRRERERLYPAPDQAEYDLTA